MFDFQPDQVHPEVVARSKEMLLDIDIAKVQAVGPAAITFYVWVRTFVSYFIQVFRRSRIWATRSIMPWTQYGQKLSFPEEISVCIRPCVCLFLVYLFLPNIMCLFYILMTVFVGCTLYADDIELLSTP